MLILLPSFLISARYDKNFEKTYFLLADKKFDDPIFDRIHTILGTCGWWRKER